MRLAHEALLHHVPQLPHIKIEKPKINHEHHKTAVDCRRNGRTCWCSAAQEVFSCKYQQLFHPQVDPPSSAWRETHCYALGEKIRGNTTVSINADLKGIDLISSNVPMPPDIAIALRSKRVLNVGSEACREKRITKRVIWRNAEEKSG